MGRLTSPTVVRDLLGRYGVRLRKGLGQHFLVDENILGKIVEATESKTEEIAVEIGAGVGTLTVGLAPHVASLFAVEVDELLVPILHEQVAPFHNVSVVQADFRDLPLAEFGNDLLLVGNLPYRITSDVLLKVIRERGAVGRAVLTVQREVGEKLVAPPGPEASRLGVHLRAYYEVEVLRKVPRTVFFPPPEVDSVLIRLRKLPTPRVQAPEEVLEWTLALIFSSRRKTLRQALARCIPVSEVDPLLFELGLDPRVRGEALPLEALDALAATLHHAGHIPSP